MRFNKIVFFSYLPLTERTFTNFYFEESIQNDVQVIYLDLSLLFFPDLINSNNFHFDGTIKISSYKGLKNYLKNQDKKDTLFISIITFEWRVLRLFRMLTKYAFNLAVFGAGVFPNSIENKASRIIRFVKVFDLNKIKTYFTNKFIYLLKKSGIIKSYDYIFMAGNYGYWGLGIGCNIDYRKAKIINVNTVDYDRFLQNKSVPSVQKDKYMVIVYYHLK